ncbi:MAG: hypothetical protein JNK20_10985 [Flavipsychrobacter sp.]|nr:hypothetical protein [Flavipsychrobacter sp.]
MKILFRFICLAALTILVACNKNNDDKIARPVITIEEKYTKLDGLNAGEELSIPVTVRAEGGVKRLAYYLITKTSNGTSSGNAINNDPSGMPVELTDTIRFKVTENFVELVVIAFDRFHNNSEIHIATDNIRSIPTIRFKDNIDQRESVFEGKNLLIEGTVESEFNLESLVYQTIINGETSAEAAVAISNPNNNPFSIPVKVQKGLTAVILKTVNEYDAVVRDTFKIGSVQDDAVVISLASGSPKIEKLYTTVDNTISGTVFSGTSVTRFYYALKKNGTYGPSQNLTIGTPADEFSFSFDFLGEKEIEAVKIYGENEGGKVADLEFEVGAVYNPLKVFRNIVLTTEIGPGKKNFFAAYQEPYVFEAAESAPFDEVIDLGFFKYTATSNNIMPPAVFAAGTNYANALAPYMLGWDKAPYTLVTANRASVNTVSFDTLDWDTQLMEHVANKVAASRAAGGEAYNIYETNRRTNNVFNVGQGFYIGWGRWDPIYNFSFGIVLVKEYVVNGDYATITLDIKVPEENQRLKYNPLSLFNYP